MIIKTKEDIKKAKNKIVTCICTDCNKQYSIPLKILKENNELRCRKCYNIKHKVKRVVKIMKMNTFEKLDEKRGYKYNDLYFENSWSLAYYIWLKDHNKKFEYQISLPLFYIDDDNIKRNHYFDFLVEGKYVEIIGKHFFNEKDEPFNNYSKKYWWKKYQFLIDNNVYIMREKEAFSYVKYVNEKYGKNFIKSHKIKKLIK